MTSWSQTSKKWHTSAGVLMVVLELFSSQWSLDVICWPLFLGNFEYEGKVRKYLCLEKHIRTWIRGGHLAGSVGRACHSWHISQELWVRVPYWASLTLKQRNEQKCIPSQVGRLEVRNPGIGRAILPVQVLGKNPSLFPPSFWWLPIPLAVLAL